MKTNISKELNTKTLEQLKGLIVKAKEELLLMILDLRRNKLKNVRSVFNKRKEIAVMLSKFKEKEIIKTK